MSGGCQAFTWRAYLACGQAHTARRARMKRFLLVFGGVLALGLLVALLHQGGAALLAPSPTPPPTATRGPLAGLPPAPPTGQAPTPTPVPLVAGVQFVVTP